MASTRICRKPIGPIDTRAAGAVRWQVCRMSRASSRASLADSPLPACRSNAKRRGHGEPGCSRRTAGRSRTAGACESTMTSAARLVDRAGRAANPPLSKVTAWHWHATRPHSSASENHSRATPGRWRTSRPHSHPRRGYWRPMRRYSRRERPHSRVMRPQRRLNRGDSRVRSRHRSPTSAHWKPQRVAGLASARKWRYFAHT